MDKQNENSTPVRIKRTRGYIPLFFMLSVVLLGLSVYCVVYAYTSKMTGIPATVFYVAGVLGIVFFAYSAFDNFFQTIQPKNALIIGNDGFADFTVGGVGVGNIGWDNVKSVKTERSKDGRLLVIELNDMNTVYDNAPKAAQKAIDRADGLTDNRIVIRQIDVTERVTKIEEIFNAHLGASKEREIHKNAEEDNSKTKVMNDDDVKAFFQAINDKTNTHTDDKPAHTEDKRTVRKPKHFADDEDDDVLIAAQDMSLHDANAVPEKYDTAEDIASSTSSENNEELPLPAHAEEKTENAEKPQEKERLIEQKAEKTASSTAENEVVPESKKEKAVEEKPSDIDDIDSLLDSVIPTSKKENKSSNLDELLTKFSNDLKNGTSKLDEKERDELTNELTAMLEDIKRKKNKK